MNSHCLNLRIAPCSAAAAEYACKNYHYSGKASGFAQAAATFGVWEKEKFIGSVIYSFGATHNIGKPFGLVRGEICELVRVALKQHETPVSRILAITLKMLHKSSKRLRMIVSFADTSQGHHGGIYQACGWIYLGKSSGDGYFRIRGKVIHSRSIHSKYGSGSQSIAWLRANLDPKATPVKTGEKHKYVWCYDEELRKKLSEIALPYPKRASEAE
jgi:hypothetical protein